MRARFYPKTLPVHFRAHEIDNIPDKHFQESSKAISKSFTWIPGKISVRRITFHVFFPEDDALYRLDGLS